MTIWGIEKDFFNKVITAGNANLETKAYILISLKVYNH